jgi:hypothetical protein
MHDERRCASRTAGAWMGAEAIFEPDRVIAALNEAGVG